MIELISVLSAGQVWAWADRCQGFKYPSCVHVTPRLSLNLPLFHFHSFSKLLLLLSLRLREILKSQAIAKIESFVSDTYLLAQSNSPNSITSQVAAMDPWQK
jgi:hypothetical protein